MIGAAHGAVQRGVNLHAVWDQLPEAAPKPGAYQLEVLRFGKAVHRLNGVPDCGRYAISDLEQLDSCSCSRTGRACAVGTT